MTDLIAAPFAPEPVASWQSRTSWGIEIGRLRLAATRTRETRSVGPAFFPPPAPRAAGGFAVGAVASAGALALLVVGAGAARPAEPRYAVELAVPPAVKAHVARVTPRLPEAGRAAHRAARTLVSATPTGDRFDAADERYVARAMATGAFQEWQGADGLPRFLTAGAARRTNGRACRDLALLVRLADGSSHVRSAERCTTGPASDSAPPPVPESVSEPGSGGAY